MAYTFNGFGTKYYGEAERRPDGSFITTEWITAAYVPLIPLRSFRFIKVKGSVAGAIIIPGHSVSYAVVEKLSIRWSQVGRVYAFVVGTVVWWIATGRLFVYKLAIFDRANAKMFALPFIAIMAVPFFVVWWFRRETFRARYASEK